MSMLSAQCDELRSMAASVGLEVPQAATLMMEAADTIWELRGSVHRERAEADRLRELVEEDSEQLDKWQKKAEYYSQLSQLSEAENAKLRELLQRTWDVFHDATAREFVTVKNELRELGVEVDG